MVKSGNNVIWLNENTCLLILCGDFIAAIGKYGVTHTDTLAGYVLLSIFKPVITVLSIFKPVITDVN